MSGSNLENQVHSDDMIGANWEFKQKNISAEIGMSQDRVHHIITKSKSKVMISETCKNNHHLT